MEDLPKDPKTAELPLHRECSHESIRTISVCFKFDRILFRLRRWIRWRRRRNSDCQYYSSARNTRS